MTEVRGLFSDNSHLEGVAFWPIDREELNSANGHSSSEKDPSPAESSDEASASPGLLTNTDSGGHRGSQEGVPVHTEVQVRFPATTGHTAPPQAPGTGPCRQHSRDTSCLALINFFVSLGKTSLLV